ncbi:MAG: phosphoglycerate kinase [Clostridia bacterium]
MKKTIEQLDVRGKKVLLRVDFNVPMNEEGKITDDTRIVASLPTIKYLLANGAKLIICSHLGRPEGERNLKYSLLPVAKRLAELVLNKIYFSKETVGPEAERKASVLKSGEILILENLRFNAGEEKNEITFSKKLAALADIYVDDAFGTAHRRHASICGVAKYLPNAVGFLMGKELNTILNVVENPERPFVVIIGGAKVSDKIYVVMNLLKKADVILIGGGMAYTFLKALGAEVGKSLVEEEKIELARQLLNEAERSGVDIILPVDHKCATIFSPNSPAINVDGQNIPDDMQAMDIGPKTIRIFKKYIKNAKTLLWNGPMGVFEFQNFEVGTQKIAKAVAKSKAKSIVGGGDSIAAIKKLGHENKVYHISTGGGASLKLLEGELLPGVEVIEDME